MQHLEDGLLHALVDGEVPSSELGPMTAHLESCAECRARLDEARAMAGESNGLIELIEVPARDAPAPAAGVPGRPRPGSSWIRPLALAASLVLAVALGYAGGASREPEALITPMPVIDTVFVTADQAAVGQAVGPTAPAAPQPQRREVSERENRPAEPADEGAVAGARLETAAKATRLDEKEVSSKSEERKQDFAARDQIAPPPATRQRAAAPSAAPDTLLKLRAGNEGAARSLARAAAPAREEAVTTLRAASISFVDAAARLDGRIRLIEGMVPLRLESIGEAIRVIYQLEQGELVLEQRREADSVAVVLIAPALSADSLAKLRSKIR